MWIAACPLARSKERRSVLPSIATTPSMCCARLAVQATKQAWKASGSRAAKTSPKVSCDGTPSLNGRKRRRNSSFILPNVDTSTQESAPQITAHRLASRTSPNGYTVFTAWRGSSSRPKCAKNPISSPSLSDIGTSTTWRLLLLPPIPPIQAIALHDHRVDLAQQRVGQRAVADADTLEVVGPHRRQQFVPVRHRILADGAAGDGDVAALAVDRHEAGIELGGQPRAIVLRGEDVVDAAGDVAADAGAPDVPELRMLLRRLRDVVAVVDEVDAGEDLTHPLIAQAAGDRFLFDGADQHRQPIHIAAGELDQILVAAMGRQELAEQEAGRGRARHQRSAGTTAPVNSTSVGAPFGEPPGGSRLMARIAFVSAAAWSAGSVTVVS